MLKKMKLLVGVCACVLGTGTGYINCAAMTKEELQEEADRLMQEGKEISERLISEAKDVSDNVLPEEIDLASGWKKILKKENLTIQYALEDDLEHKKEVHDLLQIPMYLLIP